MLACCWISRIEKNPQPLKTLRVTLFVTILCVALFPLSAGTALAQSQGDAVGFRSAQVKAAFLFRLPRFIRWPDGREASHFCFDENSDVMDTFQRLVKVKNETATVLLQTLEDQDVQCDVLFVASEREVAISPNQLIVSDRADFAREGGMIELTRKGSRVGLNINLESLKDGNLSASSQLLKLANVVEGD